MNEWLTPDAILQAVTAFLIAIGSLLTLWLVRIGLRKSIIEDPYVLSSVSRGKEGVSLSVFLPPQFREQWGLVSISVKAPRSAKLAKPKVVGLNNFGDPIEQMPPEKEFSRVLIEEIPTDRVRCYVTGVEGMIAISCKIALKTKLSVTSRCTTQTRIHD